MCEYGFNENDDFIRVAQKCPTLGGTQTIIDYEITLELSPKKDRQLKVTPQLTMCEYGFNENSDFRLVSQKRITNNPKNPYTIETDYRAITQKRVTAQGNITT